MSGYTRGHNTVARTKGIRSSSTVSTKVQIFSGSMDQNTVPKEIYNARCFGSRTAP